jgi:uncharacterized protein YigE (DUF2233 family)
VQASNLNPDHPQLSVLPGEETRPVQAILTQALKTKPAIDSGGLVYSHIESAGLRMYIWGFDIDKFSVAIVTKPTMGGIASEFVSHQKDILAVNGGFFEIDSKTNNLAPSGLLTIDGVEVQSLRANAGTGVLGVTASGISIVSAQHYTPDGIQYAVQAGPILVEFSGKIGIYNNDFNRQSRTAICKRKSRVYIVVVESGLSLYELAELLATKASNGGLECDSALNLDGGPSTQAFFRSDSQKLEVEGRWKIQNALVISRR